jgi:3-dehydroquinate dehydratase
MHLYAAGHENYITEKINNGKFKSDHVIIVSSGAYARLAVPLKNSKSITAFSSILAHITPLETTKHFSFHFQLSIISE